MDRLIGERQTGMWVFYSVGKGEFHTAVLAVRSREHIVKGPERKGKGGQKNLSLHRHQWGVGQAGLVVSKLLVSGGCLQAVTLVGRVLHLTLGEEPVLPREHFPHCMSLSHPC